MDQQVTPPRRPAGLITARGSGPDEASDSGDDASARQKGLWVGCDAGLQARPQRLLAALRGDARRIAAHRIPAPHVVCASPGEHLRPWCDVCSAWSTAGAVTAPRPAADRHQPHGRGEGRRWILQDEGHPGRVGIGLDPTQRRGRGAQGRAVCFLDPGEDEGLGLSDLLEGPGSAGPQPIPTRYRTGARLRGGEEQGEGEEHVQ